MSMLAAVISRAKPDNSRTPARPSGRTTASSLGRYNECDAAVTLNVAKPRNPALCLAIVARSRDHQCRYGLMLSDTSGSCIHGVAVPDRRGAPVAGLQLSGSGSDL